jgi:hypothetical protein
MKEVTNSYFRRIFGFLISIILWFSIIVMIIFEIVRAIMNLDNGSKEVTIVRIVGYIVLGISLLLYLFECLCISRTMKGLRNKKEVFSLYDFLQNIKETKPVIVHTIQCYHYETRVTTKTVYDSHSKTYRTETHTHQVRVNTYSERREFMYNHFKDFSDEFKLNFDRSYIRLELTKELSFIDNQTVDAINSAIDCIKRDNMYRDTHMDFYEEFTIPGFQDIIFCKSK